MNKLGIDIDTRIADWTVGRLNRLNAVERAEKMGVYHQDTNICQVFVETTMTEDELENWLWRVKFPCEGTYYGVFEWDAPTNSIP